MTAAQEPHPDAGRGAPVERFQPTSGRLVGFVSLAVIVALLGYIAVFERSLVGLRVALGVAFLGVLVWATQLRSRAAAYAEILELRNAFRDTTIPLTAIDDVSVRRTLNVWVGERRFVCVGIGMPLRKMVKASSHGPSALLGWDRMDSYTQSQTPLLPDQTVTDYSTFVETRISGLVQEARSLPASRRTTPREPVHAWAWPEIVALVGLGVAFGLTLLV